ncbi:hypothetical protein XA68_15670 [Ophiocordyceps unilateralis]|uniref:Uncharacterized protein n=1 Tax=Ophiocordyceps unilateralis TaxID=268505 RepID=A0A2A9P7M0_OPHUN|nr:hypothetical protein XA68_15670 [Ophiocordyceps unilateralis]
MQGDSSTSSHLSGDLQYFLTNFNDIYCPPSTSLDFSVRYSSRYVFLFQHHPWCAPRTATSVRPGVSSEDVGNQHWHIRHKSSTHPNHSMRFQP